MLFLGTQLGGGVKIETGSYVGNGKYGASNPNKLTFSFEPIFFTISKTDGPYSALGNLGNYSAYWWKGLPKLAFANSNVNMTLSEKTLTWFSERTEGDQFNTISENYTYFALGY